MNLQALYEYILETNLLNFLIMVAVLVWIFKYFKLGLMIDALSDSVKENVNLSVESVQKAFEEYKKIKKESRGVDSKKEEIIKNANNIIKNLEDKNQKDIIKNLESIEINANKTKEIYFEQRVQSTTKNIQKAVYELSINSIQNMMNYDIQKKLIMKSLDEFDKIEGGLNG